MATSGIAAAKAVVREVEQEGGRQAAAAKGAAATKAAGVKAAGVKSVAVKAAGTKGTGALATGATKAVGAAKTTGAVKSAALFGAKGFSLGTVGPIILGVLGAVLIYKAVKKKDADVDPSETDLDIKEALG